MSRPSKASTNFNLLCLLCTSICSSPPLWSNPGSAPGSKGRPRPGRKRSSPGSGRKLEAWERGGGGASWSRRPLRTRRPRTRAHGWALGRGRTTHTLSSLFFNSTTLSSLAFYSLVYPFLSIYDLLCYATSHCSVGPACHNHGQNGLSGRLVFFAKKKGLGISGFWHKTVEL